MPSIINATLTNGLVTSADNSGSLQLQTNNGTTAVTIDTSQNVGIGVTNPQDTLDLTRASGTTAIRMTSQGAGSLTWRIASQMTGVSNTGFAIRDETNTANRLTIDGSGNLGFNSGYGSAAVAYGCRAWVNFNGTGTVAIRASGNVSSLTDVAVGTYWVNFTNAMPDANYCVQGNKNWRGIFNPDAQETGRVYMISADTSNNTQLDAPFLFVAIFR